MADNPVPYAIVFFFLVLIALVVLTWVIGLYWKNYHCKYDPNMYCDDRYYCATGCTGAPQPGINQCFYTSGATGLGSCLYGPNASGATACYQPQTPGSTGPFCNCPADLEGAQVQNCFNGCPGTLQKGTASKVCCCKQTIGSFCNPGPECAGNN